MQLPPLVKLLRPLPPMAERVEPRESDFDGLLRRHRWQDGRVDALIEPIEKQAHAPFLLKRSNGALVMAFFHGEAEGASGNAIAVTHLEPLAEGWTKPVIVSREKGQSAQNPVLFESPDGNMTLLHTSQNAGPLGVSQASSEVRRLVSRDGGHTWTAPTVVMPRGAGAFLRGAPLYSASPAPAGGTRELMLPMYFTPNGEFDGAGQVSAIVRSRDGGATWSTDRIVIPGTEYAVGVQPAVVRMPRSFHSAGMLVAFHSAGMLVAFMRSRKAAPRFVMRSESLDDGHTWTTAKPTALPNNNSGIAAVVLPDGTIVLVFNNCGNYHRWPLTVAISQDGGETWPHMRPLVPRGSAEDMRAAIANRSLDHEREAQLQSEIPKGQLAGETSYPTAVFDEERGEIHIAYTAYRQTVGHAIVTLDWIKQGSTKELRC